MEDYLKKKFTIIGVDLFLVYDKEDHHIVESRAWYCIVDKAGKPRVIDGKGRYFHNYLIKKKNEKNVIDHIDGDSLNNRRNNLREVTRSANAQNRIMTKKNGEYLGVTKRGKKWLACIIANGEKSEMRFENKNDAIIWRYNKQKELHGEYNPEKRSLELILKLHGENYTDNKYEIIYFKRPTIIKKHTVILKDKDGVEHVVHTCDYISSAERFKNTQKYKKISEGAEWKFSD